jgi:uncharacterized membrane protein YdjX (TVP38/TMEM64 family)
MQAGRSSQIQPSRVPARLKQAVPCSSSGKRPETMTSPAHRKLVLKLSSIVVLLGLSGVMLATGYDLRTTVLRGLELLGTVGSPAFFLAMALLPSIGVPLSIFCLTAGSVFGPQLGMPSVMLFSLAAIAANIALTHLLANCFLRPPLQHLLNRYGYRLPHVQSDDVTDLIVLLRVTPGLPFPVQNYLLGLASVPFAPYFTVSCMITFPLNAAIIVFGEALLQGRGRAALAGLLFFLAVITATHLVRKRFKAKLAAGD